MMTNHPNLGVIMLFNYQRTLFEKMAWLEKFLYGYHSE